MIWMVRDSIVFGAAFLVLMTCCGCEESNPTAIIETDKGKIAVELHTEAAPKTVENFITLVQQGFYDGLTFHRFEPGFVIQGGDPKGDGTGGPPWKIPGEFQDPELRAKMPRHEKGIVAMARSTDPNSAGSQFYICLNPEPNRYRHLEGKYTTFGRVIEGLDVVDQLRKGDKMNRVTLKHQRGQINPN